VGSEMCIRDNDDVAEAFAEVEPGFAGSGALQFLLVLAVFARREVAGFGIKRFEKPVQRAGRDQVHVGLVDIVRLNFLQDFAVNGQRFVGLDIRSAAKHMADSSIATNRE